MFLIKETKELAKTQHVLFMVPTAQLRMVLLRLRITTKELVCHGFFNKKEMLLVDTQRYRYVTNALLESSQLESPIPFQLPLLIALGIWLLQHLHWLILCQH